MAHSSDCEDKREWGGGPNAFPLTDRRMSNSARAQINLDPRKKLLMRRMCVCASLSVRVRGGKSLLIRPTGKKKKMSEACDPH